MKHGLVGLLQKCNHRYVYDIECLTENGAIECPVPFLLTPLRIHPLSFSKGPGLEVSTTMNCMSRQVRLGLASSARAHMPAAKGADAEVPTNTILLF